MKYVSTNELRNFSFHDGRIESICFRDERMIWKVCAINATKENTQNDFEKDMCIAAADMIFEDANIDSVVFNAYKVYDSAGNLLKESKARTVTEEEYSEIQQKSTGNYWCILSAIEPTQNTVNFEIDSIAGSYNITISYSKIVIKWDEFDGEAWYEDEKWKRRE